MATDYRAGDYRTVAARLRPAAEQLVAACSPGPRQLVVDVAAGSGNVARLCTARGARVLAVDHVPEQLLLGRAEGDDPAMGWVAGDAHALPVRDGAADAALSAFGIIYAERPDVAVQELARVCRPGGTVGLTAWPSGGYQEASAGLLDELTGTRQPHDHLALWGTPERIRERLAAVADEVRVTTGELVVRAGSVDEWWHGREAAPSVASAREVLSADGYAELGRRMRELGLRFGHEDDGGFVLRDEYLVAVATVRSS